MTKSELAREIMRAVFTRIGGSSEIEKAKAYLVGLSPEGFAEIKAEALAALNK